ncbi:MAG: hypothetical protein RIC55_35315 [Pirellulaceae bacterium]
MTEIYNASLGESDSDSFVQPMAQDWPINVPQLLKPGLVNHVRAFAVLSVLQGVYELVGGLLQVSFSAAEAPIIFAERSTRLDLFFLHPSSVLRFFIATLLITAAGAHLLAGWLNYRFQARAVGFIAIGSGLFVAPLCTYFVSAMALAVYGMIVLRNEEVFTAFQLRKQGFSCTELLSRFSAYRR